MRAASAAVVASLARVGSLGARSAGAGAVSVLAMVLLVCGVVVCVLIDFFEIVSLHETPLQVSPDWRSLARAGIEFSALCPDRDRGRGAPP